MEFLLTVRDDKGYERDVAVTIDPEQKILDLAIALSDHFLVPITRMDISRTRRPLDFEMPIRLAGVLSGDVLIANGDPGPVLPQLNESRTLDFIVGPESGRYLALAGGTSHSVGRSSSNSIPLDYGLLAEQHFCLTVGLNLEAEIMPLDGKIEINGAEVFGSARVGPEDFVEAGQLGFAVRDYRRVEDRIDRLGQVEFHRTPYRQQTIRERVFTPLGPIPSTAAKNRFQYLMVLAPVFFGLTLFLTQGRQVAYLLFILLSPLLLLANYFDDKRRGKRTRKQDREAFESLLAQRVSDLCAAVEDERRERWNTVPDTPSLLRRAEYRTIDLWPRGRESSDFLAVRLGLFDSESQILSPLDRGGDEDLRALALQQMKFSSVVRDVPYVLSLAEKGAIAVVGGRDRTLSAVSSLVLQMAALHSPEDLVMAIAARRFSEGEESKDLDLISTTKWIPHTRSLSSPLEGAHICSNKAALDRLLGSIIAIADGRLSSDSASQRRRWPWMLVVIDNSMNPNPTQVAQLLERCPDAGISVIWISETRAEVPRQVPTVIETGLPAEDGHCLVWSTDPAIPDYEIKLGTVSGPIFDSFVRALAPLRDASEAQAAASIPKTAPLLDVLEVEQATAGWVTERWQKRSSYSLEHAIGFDVDGPFPIDLVAHGPHALIGGTSGSGKSELLQSMVASLVSSYSPERLNLLFIDYKGGAASDVFNRLPHTVGCVTNLEEHLALRALTSLRAELDHRMEVITKKHGCKDLREMMERYPDQSLPSLVIIVDEFATLVKEIPDFIAGIVDIAQRGRSLGIHLVLATQRPSGAVNDNILANTNLRISLRMLESSESTAVIGAPNAADIPVPLRGRGYARLGPRELHAFQAAYSGAPLVGKESNATVEVVDFDGEVDESDLIIGQSSTRQDQHTHLSNVIDAVCDAFVSSGLEKPRTPWKNELPKLVLLTDLVDAMTQSVLTLNPGRDLCLGLVDDPESQDQYPGLVDIESHGGLLVFGSGGAGKTTLIRSLLSIVAVQSTPEQVEFVVFDFGAKALQTLKQLPHVSGYANGDDMESVTRLLAVLGIEIEKRRQLLAESMSETLSAHILKGNKMSRILIVVDEYHNFVASMGASGLTSQSERWIDRLTRVLIDGRALGIHTILTADRRASIPTTIHSSVSARIVLRQSNDLGYNDLGVAGSTGRVSEMPPGTGYWINNKLVQVACVAQSHDSLSQSQAIEELVCQLAKHDRAKNRSDALPSVLKVDPQLVSQRPDVIFVGEEDISNRPTYLDLGRSDLLISGPPMSGKSNALLVMAAQLRDHVSIATVGSSTSPLRLLESDLCAFGKIQNVEMFIRDLVSSRSGTKTYLLIDDLDMFGDPNGHDLWSAVASTEDLVVIATIESQSFSAHSYNDLIRELKRSRSQLLFQPENTAELSQTVGIRLVPRPGLEFTPGRGFLVANRNSIIVQTPLSPLTRNLESVGQL